MMFLILAKKNQFVPHIEGSSNDFLRKVTKKIS